MSDDHTPVWVLRPLGVTGAPAVIELTAGGTTIGRDPANSVVLDGDVHPSVSANHARIDLVDGTPHVADLGATNGTLLNGRHVEQSDLAHGDVVQLGDHGPRFAVVRKTDMNDTLDVAAEHLHLGAHTLRDSTITELRARLDSPNRESVRTQVEAGRKRTLVLVSLLCVGALVLVGIGISVASSAGRTRSENLQKMNDQLRAEVADARADLDAQRSSIEEQRTALVAERDALRERLVALESEGASTSEVMAALRGQLKDANDRLDLFDPVNLEKQRLADVAMVHRAVVLIEATTHFREVRSRRRLHVRVNEDGLEFPNLDFEGELYAQESTGSGFCVTSDGYLLTNAHVVMPQGPRKTVIGPEGLTFAIETKLEVVFTGTDVRLPAKLLDVAFDEQSDLALIRIEPFEGMPHLDQFDLDTDAPEAGNAVFLFGFPLGKLALQEGDRVVASTFKGILSRRVGGFLQVDAAVHPGNSGGPVTNEQGKVIGIVARVQNTPQGVPANEIGYVIPIADAADVWPPKVPE